MILNLGRRVSEVEDVELVVYMDQGCRHIGKRPVEMLGSLQCSMYCSLKSRGQMSNNLYQVPPSQWGDEDGETTHARETFDYLDVAPDDRNQ
jgi:hypothetical protein